MTTKTKKCTGVGCSKRLTCKKYLIILFENLQLLDGKKLNDKGCKEYEENKNNI